MEMIAICGLDCAKCPAYIATQANDVAARERIAAEWREAFKDPSITADTVICDGCSAGERHSGYCQVCQVRTCGISRGVAQCGACPDYACETLEGFFKSAPEVRENLEGLRKKMGLA